MFAALVWTNTAAEDPRPSSIDVLLLKKGEVTVDVQGMTLHHFVTGFKASQWEMCGAFDLSPDKIRAYFEQAKPMTDHEIHYSEDVLFGPCFVSGAVKFQVPRENLAWRIRIGGIASIEAPDGTYQCLAATTAALIKPGWGADNDRLKALAESVCASESVAESTN